MIDDIQSGDELDIEMVSADGNDLSATVDVREVLSDDGGGGKYAIEMNGTHVTMTLSETVEDMASVSGLGPIKNNGQRIATVTDITEA